MEHLGRELRQAETALECNKKKLEAARARIKVLENEAADAKRNLIILSDRTIHDDQLIEALNVIDFFSFSNFFSFFLQ